MAAPALLKIARRAGTDHSTGCEAFLELIDASDRLRIELRRELAQARITHTGFNILTLVLRGGAAPIGTGGIAGKLNLSPQTVSAALARLELAGFVTLVRQPDNRRRINVSLTVAGATMIRAALERIEGVIARLMHVVSAGRLRQLQKVCSRLAPAPPTTDS